MATVCNTELTNLGKASCGLEMSEIKRVLFTSYLKEDGTANKILKTDATAIANWQTLFSKWSFSSDKLEKVIPSCLIYGFMSDQQDAANYDADGYFEKLADGTYLFRFKVIAREADYIKALKEMENNQVAVYLGDASTRIWGRQTSASDLYLYPYRLKNIAVPNFNFKTREAPSMVELTMTLEDPTHANDTTSVTIADGDISLDTDFYSLEDGTATATSPTANGVVLALVNTRYNTAITGQNDGATDYLKWKFYSASAPTVAVVPSATGDIVESPDGTYTLSKTSIFSADTWTYKLELDRYNIASGTFVVT